MVSTLYDGVLVSETTSHTSLSVIKGSQQGALTREELQRMAIDFARMLRNGGIQPGDTVTLVDPNTVEFVVAFLGTTFARAIVAPLNQNYTTEEFRYYMEDAESKLLVTGAQGNEAAEKTGIVPCISLKVDVEAKKMDVWNAPGKVFSVKREEEAATLHDPPTPEDVALFLHTSGTTSRPKGVPLSHGNLVASLHNIRDTYEFSEVDVSLLVMPLFHVHGLMAGLLSPLLAGASVVLPAAGKFSAGTFWKDAADYKVTYYTAVPTMHQILVSRADEDFPKDNPPPIRVIRSCSSSLAPATLFEVEEKFGAPVLEAYAMTEASHQMTSNPLPKHGERKPGTVGKPQGTVQVAILDESCNVLGPGQRGEVCIKGPNVTSGYKNNNKANEEAFAGGWFHTGDQGMLGEDGYLTLTGRIKELINRGGEKISPLEVDSALLGHPWVGEAVSFSAPDEKYGEIVAAAIVLNQAGQTALSEQGEEDIKKTIKDYCKDKLAAFKIPAQMFITDNLPKNATGKIQRRFMVDAFITKSRIRTGFDLAAATLHKLGIRHMFGVIGIPVTQMASAAQTVGIRFISCRNEQAAGYAAAAAGFLTGRPGVLLTVSGPGMIHGIAGLSHAKVNGWPLIMISGSCETEEVGKGAFQELDQCSAASMYVKRTFKVSALDEIPLTLNDAVQSALKDGLGSCYVDIPSNIFMSCIKPTDDSQKLISSVSNNVQMGGPVLEQSTIENIIQILSSAQRPLLVLGTGCAACKIDENARNFVKAWKMPFISSSMARGVVPDSDPMCVNAARSLALSKADVVLILGSPLNWQLHFGEPPKWSKDVKFVILDSHVPPREQRMASVSASCDLDKAVGVLSGYTNNAPESWIAELQAKVALSKEKLSARLAKTAFPLDYQTTLRVIRDAINKLPLAPVVVSEGANTMDQARILLEPVDEARCRLDAGAWGTMGVGPGCAIAAATVTGRHVIAVEGDSAFGFSGMEVETACRYNLSITFIVFNNGGIYGGDRRPEEVKNAAAAGLKLAGYPNDPPPTSFVPGARYDMLAKAFGGEGFLVETAESLQTALETSMHTKGTAVINVLISPTAGVESGTVHAFNAPKK